MLAAGPLLGAHAASAGPRAVAGGNLAGVFRTEQFVLRSEIVGADFLIQVGAPFEVLKSTSFDAGHRFPAVYVTDGGWLFAMAAPVRAMIEPSYLIGIGYPEELEPIPEDGMPRPITALGRWRNRDLLHNPDPPLPPWLDPSAGAPPPALTPPPGGGAKFRAFLTEELRPLIERRYPVAPDRAVLLGHSLGGTFAAKALGTDPEAFAGYVIGSPATWLEPGLAELVRAAAPKGEGRKVFLGVGALEGGFISMADELEAALTGTGATFDVRRETFADEDHLTAQLVLMTHGLRHVLPPLPAIS